MSPSDSNQKCDGTSPPSPTYPHWHDIIAGAASGLGARALTAPLDLLKIRRQLQPSSAPATVASTKVAVAANTTPAASFADGEWKIFHNLHSIAEKEGGLRSLFRGNVAASYLWMGYSVAQFSLYGYATEYLHRRYPSLNGNDADQSDVKISGAISFASGAASGFCATIITYPFDLCRTIFAARGLFPIAASNVTWSDHTTNLVDSMGQQQYVQRRPPRTVREFAHQMYRQKGFRGFYAGGAPGLLQIVPYMGINFALHDILVMLSGSADSRVSGVAGMAAGVVSKLLVYPLDTVKKRLQAQAFWGGSSPGGSAVRKGTKFNTALPKNPKKLVGAVNNRGVMKQQHGGPVVYDGMVDCFRQIAKREGMTAFYKGLIPSLVKSSVSTGASFWLFTLTKNMLQSVHDSGHF